MVSNTYRWATARPWLGTIARVGLAAVWLIAGGAKVGDLAGSGRAVAAFKLMPADAARFVGAALPFIEIALGLLLLLGLATRLVAAISAVLFAVYIVGIASAWARGLSIDCGCFGGGGQLATGQHPNYGPDIIRDLGLLVLAGFLVVWPRTRLAVDKWLLVEEAA
ncbi:DoxX family membrane protein [Planosporangium thailandense]|uniref:DoxX family membrane protein n=1 Tax=Planosporangium thailandense TaxID=765197 RepID=A0ABX0Y5N0_9ACTN|nr:MauE/DoxX family redox-associated membrane protein [Planosporangium thailandense]NJC73716.1 DoxX family membrane protein [Planosporangium thailandense]